MTTCPPFRDFVRIEMVREQTGNRIITKERVVSVRGDKSSYSFWVRPTYVWPDGRESSFPTEESAKRMVRRIMDAVLRG